MYLEIDDGFLEHPKTLRFCRAIADPCGATYLLRLWTWATKSAPDGDLRDMEPDELELALRWRGDPGVCYAALVSAGFIDKDDDGATIHNWGERTGGAIVRMEQGGAKQRESATERKRMQRKRERERKAAEAAAGGHANVTRDTGVTSRPVTPLDKTRQDEARQDPSANDARAGDPPATTPGPVALAHAVAMAVEEAGELVAAQGPPLALVRGGTPTGFDVVQLFGKVRGEVLKVPGWNTPQGQSPQKADRFVAGLRAELVALLEPSMRLFFTHARDPTARSPDPRLLETTFGFAAWLSRFPDLCEELSGSRKAVPGKGAGPKYCAFHGRERSAGKRAPKHEWRLDCPECRHVDARSIKRESEPTSIGEVFGGFQPGG
jgi:hypothetical protein